MLQIILLAVLKLKVMGKNSQNSAAGGVVYAFGVIGAAIYYISAATEFWASVIGLGKAFVWPVFLVYELLKFLEA
jgi:hypothetical protein